MPVLGLNFLDAYVGKTFIIITKYETKICIVRVAISSDERHFLVCIHLFKVSFLV